MESSLATSPVNSIKKLRDVDSYMLWKFQIDIHLKTSGLYYLVSDGQSESSKSSRSKRVSDDTRMQKLIIDTVEENVCSQIMSCASGRHMYNKIKDIFQADAEVQKATLLSQFDTFQYKSEDSATGNVRKLQLVAKRLSGFGKNISDSQLIDKIITTLPEKFSELLRSWNLLPPEDRNISNLIVRLTAAENGQFSSAPGAAATSSADSENSTLKIKICNFCLRRGHEEEECRFLKFSSSVAQPLTCSNCKKQGHSIEGCLFLKSTVPEKNLCITCNKFGHLTMNCTFRKRYDASSVNSYCNHCGKAGHSVNDCFYLLKTAKACSNCKKTGHLVENCRFLLKKPWKTETSTNLLNKFALFEKPAASLNKSPKIETGPDCRQGSASGSKGKCSHTPRKKMFCRYCKKIDHDIEECRYRPKIGTKKPSNTSVSASASAEHTRETPAKDINILILGETGVGKSTWINGFMNFLTYDSLSVAERGELIATIPSKFTMFNDKFEQVTISTGADENEDLITGHSATQEAKIYAFPVAPNVNVRLIDTPGIGDTRGIEQDKVNFQSILATLSKLKEIHGVCILLKPNNSRLTVVFRFCVQELLTHLHRDASKNIVFCFTNTRGTFYRPGDTMPALKALLNEKRETANIPINENTVYCFDSEAYRFLAAVKNDPPVKFPESERANFAQSWERSINETMRLLFYIAGREPHPIQSTINLNYARQLILQMTRPLAEISRNIQTNKAILLDEKEEIEQMAEDLKSLKSLSMTNRTEIENTPLSRPRTVCSNSNCVKIWSHGNEKISSVEYVQLCHNPCYLNDVPADTVGDPGLIHCWAMNGTMDCTQCFHRYTEHLHIYYESKQVLKQVENMAVKESIRKNLSAAEMKSKMIEEKNRLLAELENETEIIKETSAEFAIFLKSNAITPYNDAMKSYLDYLIREEKDKVDSGGERIVLDGLMLDRQSYLEKIQILENAMANGDASGTMLKTLDVNDAVGKLGGLKHNGHALRDALKCINQTAQHEYKENVVNVPFIKSKKGLFRLVDRICSGIIAHWPFNN